MPALDADTVHGALDEAARFITEVFGPLNVVGDQQGSQLVDGKVLTPDGWADAYRKFVDAGWGALPFDPEFGGGGFPDLIGIVLQEMMVAANMSFSLGPLLTQGAIHALEEVADAALTERYLSKLVTGEWTGTMNLTEPEAGSDVGALRTRAVPNGDGSWSITGSKIFITYGEHDMTDNIIHLVLARTPDAPPGTKGISCFLVPKYLVGDDGSIGARNDLRCVSVEHKMGIHASPTCVMSYGDEGGATGWLLGEEFDGMRVMFVMMNMARLSVGVQGLGIGERATQASIRHANERLQGQLPGGQQGRQRRHRRTSRHPPHVVHDARVHRGDARPALRVGRRLRPLAPCRRRHRAGVGTRAVRAAHTGRQGVGDRPRRRARLTRRAGARRDGLRRGDRRSPSSSATLASPRSTRAPTASRRSISSAASYRCGWVGWSPT